MSVSHFSECLLFDFYGSTQDNIDRLLPRYSQLRNYYAQPGINYEPTLPIPGGAGVYALAQVVADAINATLIAYGHPNFRPGRYPILLPAVSEFGESNRTIDFVRREYYSNRSSYNYAVHMEFPTWIPVDHWEQNFVVCEHPRTKIISSWSFSVFLHPFDYLTWLLLSIAIILVSIFTFSSINSGCKFVLLPTLSALLSEETAGVGHEAGDRSKLYVLWLFFCLVLAPFYTGDMASKIISPPKDDRMSTIEDLERENYTIIYGNQVTLDSYNDIITSCKNQETAGVKVLKKILKRTAFRSYDRWDFIKALVDEEKVASIMGWNFAVSFLNQGNRYESYKPLSPEKRRKCYIGKEVVNIGNTFNIFLPPRNAKLANQTRYIWASGIAQRWWYEYQAAHHSERVQSRVKVKGPTHVIDESVLRIIELKMERETITIFLLWGCCIMASVICWAAENFIVVIASMTDKIGENIFYKLLSECIGV